MKSWPELACAGALAAVVGLAVAIQPSAQSAASAPASAHPGNGFVVQGARVFDGERDLSVATVVVRDGVFWSVTSEAAVPECLAVVDGSVETLLPGLIDAHVHAWGAAQRDMVIFGVTSALDMHGDAARLPGLCAQRDATTNADLADL